MSQKVEELHLSITPINREKYHYLVRTEASPKGVLPAEEQVIFPVAEWLEQASRLMDDSVAGLWQEYGLSESLEDDFLYDTHEKNLDQEIAPSDSHQQPAWRNQDVAVISSRSQTRTLVDLGREMYETLFQGNLRDRLTSAIAIAHNQGAVLRLRLGLKDSILSRLPWEVLHEDSRPIATGKDVIFSRYQPTSSSLILPPPPTSPLRILMVVAAPTDQANLALKKEAKVLKAELKKPTTNRSWGNTPLPQIELDILEHPDREKLTQVLEQNSYHVLHYAGHSNLGSRGGELYLVNQQTGLGEVLNGDDLAGLLVNNGIHLAVFNSCRSTHSAKVQMPETNNNPRTLAEVLVNRGIPAVLAMAERIPDQVALTLTRLFYYNLKQGYPVDLSLNRARQGLMSTYGSDQLYWALPVLYLHEKYQGYLTQQPSRDSEELFIPPRHPFNSSSSLGNMPRKTNSNGAGYSWRIAPNEPGDLVDDLEDNGEDEDYFFQPGDEEFLAGEDEFLDTARKDDEENEFLDYDLGAEADQDAESLVADIFSELGLGKPGSADGKSGQLSAQEGIFPDIPGTESEADQVGEIVKAVSQKHQFTKAQSQKSTRSPGKLPGKLPGKSPALNTNTVAKPAKSHKAFKWRFGVICFLTIALFAGAIRFWRFYNQTNISLPTSSVSPEPTSTPNSQPTFNPNQEKVHPWQNLSTPELSAIAIENFAQGKLSEGVMAVNLLLDRGALPQAKASLEVVPNQKKNSPEINFLYGRLAWQFVQTGNKDYSVSDARRFWEAAVKSDPNSTLYANALAFAYYAEGNIDLASDMWLKVVTLLETTQALDHPEALTAYAGLALVMVKSSATLAPEEKNVLLSKAVKQRKMVMKLAASDFQPGALAKNWMWPPSAIADWQKLLTLEN